MSATPSTPTLAGDPPVIQCHAGAAVPEAAGHDALANAGSSSTWQPSFVGYDPETDPRRVVAAANKQFRFLGRQRALLSKFEAQRQHTQQNEPPPIPYTPEDVSRFIIELSSEDCELFGKVSDLYPTPMGYLSLTGKTDVGCQSYPLHRETPIPLVRERRRSCDSIHRQPHAGSSHRGAPSVPCQPAH